MNRQGPCHWVMCNQFAREYERGRKVTDSKRTLYGKHVAVQSTSNISMVMLQTSVDDVQYDGPKCMTDFRIILHATEAQLYTR